MWTDPVDDGFGTRLLAWVKKEVSAGDLEAFRASGSGVHHLLLAADLRREQLALDGRDLWTAPPAAQAELLSIWCADALQTLGDTYLQAAYDADPPPAGHVPELIHTEALAFYHRVETWVIRARKAAVSPDYRLRARLPDNLPAWAESDPCPPEHLHRGLDVDEDTPAQHRDGRARNLNPEQTGGVESDRHGEPSRVDKASAGGIASCRRERGLVALTAPATTGAR